MEPKLDQLDKLLLKYPGLDFILLGGVVSVKLCRTILEIDRWEMQDLQTALLQAGCIRGLSNSTFRAVPAAEEFIKERIG